MVFVTGPPYNTLRTTTCSHYIPPTPYNPTLIGYNSVVGYGASQIGSHSAVGLSVCRSVGQSVSHNQSVEQSVRREEKNVFPVTSRFVMRRRGAEGSIYTRKGLQCQDTRQRPIYTTTVEA